MKSKLLCGYEEDVLS